MKTSVSTRSSATQPLRLGILGGANIARQFCRDVAASAWVRVDAVASRSAESAAAFAAASGIARHHGSYEALLADPQIDAIYLPLPNSLHAEWAIKAAQAGKHVLCEKPLALDLAQASAMFDAARRQRTILLEAYPWWFEPHCGALVELLRDGTVGEVRSVQASFGFTLPNAATNIRMRPELGGGALLDTGSYPLSLICLAMGSAPQQVVAHATWADTGVDISLMATLLFSDGRRAQMSCAMDAAPQRRAMIVGRNGVVETEYLNHCSDQASGHPWGYVPNQMRLRRGASFGVPFEDVRTGSGSGFAFAAEAFARLVAEQDFAAFERAAACSLNIAASLTAIAQSARSGQAVVL